MRRLTMLHFLIVLAFAIFVGLLVRRVLPDIRLGLQAASDNDAPAARAQR